jgi:uncharacterized lipoprotein YddW (UPF0748 family)
MLEHCKDFGFSKIYWRVFDAGIATYASNLVELANYKDVENSPWYTFVPLPEGGINERLKGIDYHEFDSLAAAIEIGHDIGLEIHAWMTINEDDHGFGWPSRFTLEHPEYRWVRRDGRPFHSQLSFAFPEVREYKLSLIKEMLEYDIDGIFLD